MQNVRRLRCSCTLCGGLSLILLVVGVAVTQSRADLAPSDIEILRLVAAAHKNNTERISTWIGKATVVDRKVDASDRGYTMTSKIDFVSDEAQGKRWHWNVVEYLDRNGEQMSPRPDLLEKSDEMLRKDGFFQYSLGFTPAGTDSPERTVVIWPTEEAAARIQPSSRSFDPMWYLSPGGIPLHRRLLNYCDNAERVQGLSVVREGDVVTVEHKRDDGTDRFRFDLAKGGNLVERYASDNRGEWVTCLTYEQEGDVWCPKSYSRTVATGGKTEWERRVTFDENHINRPVNKEELTLDAMGVRYGTRVTDHRIGLFYEYRNEVTASGVLASNSTSRPRMSDSKQEVVSPAHPPREDGLVGTTITSATEPMGQQETAPQGGVWRSLVVWSLAILAGVFLLVMVIRLLRKRRSDGR